MEGAASMLPFLEARADTGEEDNVTDREATDSKQNIYVAGSQTQRVPLKEFRIRHEIYRICFKKRRELQRQDDTAILLRQKGTVSIC
jgi:hypothetical protein